jgi:hypothetical protein
LGVHRHDQRIGLHHRRVDRLEVGGARPLARGMHPLQRVDEVGRHRRQRQRPTIAIGDVIAGAEHQEARETAILQRATAKRVPERARRGHAVQAGAGLDNVLPRVLLRVGIFGAEEGGAGAGGELGE